MLKQAATVSMVEVPNEGLVSLIGSTIMVETLNFNYTGVLDGVNDTQILLREPKTVFETGDYKAKEWADAQRLPTSQMYIRLSAVQSYYKVER